MTEFPEKTRVSIPANVLLPGLCLVAVRLSVGEDPVGVSEYYGKRLHHFEVDASVLRTPDFLASLEGQRLRVSLSHNAMLDDSAAIDALRRMSPVFLLRPDADLVRNLNFLTSLNFGVHIDAACPTPDEKALESALDFYLHNPLLSTPVEPFHTLFQTTAQQRGPCLWDTEEEHLKRDFFVAEEGWVSLSARWLAAGTVYGTVDDPWETLIQSEAYQDLSAYRVTLFQRKSPCALCPHLGPCGGFLRAIDPEWPCDGWQVLFATLDREAKRAKDVLHEVDGMLGKTPGDGQARQ